MWQRIPFCLLAARFSSVGSPLHDADNRLILPWIVCGEHFGQQTVGTSPRCCLQFLLFLKILQEFEKGQDSILFPWLESLPREFSNAVSFDGVELECLPPFAWSLATIEILHLEAFVEALNMTHGIVSQQTIDDHELLHWAFNVVFTRCWGKDGDDEENRKDIVPMGDMFNHRYPGNVNVIYDDDGNCDIILKDDVQPGTPLYLS